MKYTAILVCALIFIPQLVFASQFYEFKSDGSTIETPELFFNTDDLILVSWQASKTAPCDTSSNYLYGTVRVLSAEVPQIGGSGNVNFRVTNTDSSLNCSYAQSYNYIATESGSLTAYLTAGSWVFGTLSVSIQPQGGGGTSTTSPYIIDVGSTIMLGAMLAFAIAYWIIGLVRGKSKIWN